MSKEFVSNKKNILIRAKKINLGKNISFGNNIDVDIRGEFTLGDRSRLGSDVHIRGNNISFGNDLFHTRGLQVGGGGRTNPTANLSIGDRCTIHNNNLNIYKEIVIGNDVGLSTDVVIMTHGYWLSVLEGFPAKFEGVTIGDGVIVGQGVLILPGVVITNKVVIGTGSIVTKSLSVSRSIYAGNPAKYIREVHPLLIEEKIKKVKLILKEYDEIAKFHGIRPKIELTYPYIKVNNCKFDVENLVFGGDEDEETDDFRDFVRKWGLRFFSERPFKSVFRGRK